MEEEPFYKKTWFIVLSAFILIGVFGNISEVNEEPLKVEELDSYRSEDGHILHVTGKIKNTRSHTLDGIGVEINLLNTEGNLVGSTLDYVKNLEPGKTWEFDATDISPDNVSDYEVAEIVIHDN